MRALVTTSPSGDDAEAAGLAERFGLEAQRRRGRTVKELLADAGGAPVFLLGSGGAELVLNAAEQRSAGVSLGGKGAAREPGSAEAPPPRSFRASLGMAVLRLQRSLAGEVDPLVEAAQLRAGDLVIDATLGLGGDALLASHATCARVLGLERSPLLAAFTQVALRRPGGAGALAEAARVAGARIEVSCGDHLAALAALPSRSADVVLFDPMFRLPSASSPLFALVRACADPTPLSVEALREARRVARRGVLIKDASPGRELGRLGMRPLPSRRFPRIVFGWVEGV